MIIDDDVAAQIVLKRISLAFRSHGDIACDFVKERGVFTARSADGDGTGGGGRDDAVRWSQSCVSVLERSPSLMRAIQLADDAFFPPSTIASTSSCDDKCPRPRDVDRHFKPPLYEPHYSFMYGNDSPVIPASLECPPSFASADIALVWTEPSTLEGVQDWKEIGRVTTKGSIH
jgi:hypothetical protein